jgi:hypothetical protein
MTGIPVCHGYQFDFIASCHPFGGSPAGFFRIIRMSPDDQNMQRFGILR